MFWCYLYPLVSKSHNYKVPTNLETSIASLSGVVGVQPR